MTVTGPESIQTILNRAREFGSKHSGKVSRDKKDGQYVGRSLQYTGPIFKNLGQILTPEELADRLKVSVGWIYEKRRPRCPKPIPAIPMGRTMRFDWNAVTKWLEELAAEDEKDLQQRRTGVPVRKTARKKAPPVSARKD
jgi:excisionase family DNA binding protein